MKMLYMLGTVVPFHWLNVLLENPLNILKQFYFRKTEEISSLWYKECAMTRWMPRNHHQHSFGAETGLTFLHCRLTLPCCSWHLKSNSVKHFCPLTCSEESTSVFQKISKYSYSMAQSWDSLHHKAKTLEARLEVPLCTPSVPISVWDTETVNRISQKRVQNYSSIAQKINANFLCDEGTVIILSFLFHFWMHKFLNGSSLQKILW